MPISVRPSAFSSVAAVRIATGLLQGLSLYLLFNRYEAKAWPATQGVLFVPLVMIALFVPMLILTAAATMRPVRLAAWAAIAAIIVAGLGLHDTLRGAALEGVSSDLLPYPSGIVLLSTAALLFIAHSLIVPADVERRRIASHGAHFDTAWKLALQLGLAAVFVGLFWGMLWLGASLFELIKLKFLATLLKKSWFNIPVTALALACALHVTDVRAVLVRGTRTLVLTLFSWLLPLVALIALGFIANLPFTGLEPLWNTRRAALIVLTMAGAIIVFINATYQDGDAERMPGAVLRWTARMGAVLLVPLVAIAAWAAYLRVAQYGWTTDRVILAAAIIIATCYALGYAWAAIAPGPWLRPLPVVNTVTAYAIIAVALMLLTPLADPSRIAVQSQVARLESGAIPPERFDFANLRFDGARYGRTVLERLKADNREAFSSGATRALAMKSRYNPQMVAPPKQLADLIMAFPAGRALPADFLNQDWNDYQLKYRLPACMMLNSTTSCRAFLRDMDGDGAEEILIQAFTQSASDSPSTTTPSSRAPLVMFSRRDDKWIAVGDFPTVCADPGQALEEGKANLSPPRWHELEIDGKKIRANLWPPMHRQEC